MAMRTTIDIPDFMLRQIKSKCAVEGRTMRSATLLFFQNWIDGGAAAMEILSERSPSSSVSLLTKAKGGKGEKAQALPSWFGIAAKHIRHDVPHDMKSVRASIAKGRADELAVRGLRTISCEKSFRRLENTLVIAEENRG